MTDAPLTILYDGQCGLCQRVIQFTLARDRHGRFRYAMLQGEIGRSVLARHGLNPDALDTFYVVERRDGPDERLLARGVAGVRLLRGLGGAWRLAAVLAVIPAPVLNFFYRIVAKRRYRWFGVAEQCLLPTPERRARFLD